MQSNGITDVSKLHRFLQPFTFEWGQFDPLKYGPYKLLMRTYELLMYNIIYTSWGQYDPTKYEL